MEIVPFFRATITRSDITVPNGERWIVEQTVNDALGTDGEIKYATTETRIIPPYQSKYAPFRIESVELGEIVAAIQKRLDRGS